MKSSCHMQLIVSSGAKFTSDAQTASILLLVEQYLPSPERNNTFITNLQSAGLSSIPATILYPAQADGGVTIDVPQKKPVKNAGFAVWTSATVVVAVTGISGVIYNIIPKNAQSRLTIRLPKRISKQI